MKIEELPDIFASLEFPDQHEKEHPDRASVTAARTRITQAISDNIFMSQCIALELARVESGQLQWGLAPFHIVPGFGIRIAFGYWPPGGSPGPHEHTAWTITGVWRNQLEVFTYDRPESYRQFKLVAKNQFHARPGDVGFIWEPCIHEPKNLSQDWSLSLHVSSPRDGEPVFDLGEPLSCLTRPGSALFAENHPYMHVVKQRTQQNIIYQLARVLAGMAVPTAAELLNKCALLGGPRARKFVLNKTVQANRDDRFMAKPRVLRRAHPDLVLSCCEKDDLVVLRADTPQGAVEELAVNSFAKEAIKFITQQNELHVDALPGSLDIDEKREIAEFLEMSGLFANREL